jgi:TolA-binding protein
MFKKVIFICALGMLLAQGVQAQKTAAVSNPVSYYNRGLELFDKEKYGSAIHEFEDFLKITPDTELGINAKYYVAVSSLMLEHDGAEERLEAFAEAHPHHIKSQLAYFQLGRFYYNAGKYNKIVPALKRTTDEALTIDESLEYHFMMGYGNFKHAKWEDATAEFNITAHDKTKYYYPSHYYLGYIALKENNYKQALQHFEKVKDSKVYAGEIPLYIALIHFGAGQYKEVLAVTDTMTHNDNKREIAWMRGQCYYYLDNFESAMPLLEENQPPTARMTPVEHYILGYCYYSTRKYEKSYEELSLINRSKDTVTQYAYYTAAECFLRLERKANARNAFLQASLLDYNAKLKERSTFNYAKLCYDLGYNSEALTAISKFIKEFPKSDLVTEAKTLQGEVLLVGKKYEEAIEVLESITKMNEQTQRVYQQITFYHALELLDNGGGNTAKAAELLVKSKKYPLDEKLDALADFWQGEIAFKGEKYWDCIKYTRNFLTSNSAKNSEMYAVAYYNLGYSYIMVGNEDKSFKDLNTHYAKAAENFKTYTQEVKYIDQNQSRYLDGMTRLADCYFVLKKYDEALEAYNFIITKSAPNSDYGHFQKGMIFGLQGKDELKISTLKKVPALYPHSQLVDDALYEIAMVHLNTNNNAEAERGFGYLLGEHPNGPYAVKCHLRLGILFYRQNKTDKAIKEFETVVQDYSSYPEAKEATKSLEEIYSEKGELDSFYEKYKDQFEKDHKDSAMYNSALSRYQDDRCADAVKEFTKYLKSFPNGIYAVDANYYKAQCEYKLQNLDAALENYLFVLGKKRFEFTEQSTRSAATIYYLKKDYQNALPLYEKLEDIAQEKDNMLVSLLGQMRCSYFLNYDDKTLAYSKKLLAYNKVTREGIIEANVYLVRIYLKKQDWQPTEDAAKEVLKLTNNQYGAEAKYSIAFVQYKKGRPADAEKTIMEVVKNFAAYDYWKAKALLLQTDILIEKKDNFQATAILNSIIDGYEDQDDGIIEEAKTKLEKIGGQ